MTSEDQRRTVRVPHELWSNALTVASQRGDNLSAVVRDALRRYIRRSK